MDHVMDQVMPVDQVMDQIMDQIMLLDRILDQIMEYIDNQIGSNTGSNNGMLYNMEQLWTFKFNCQWPELSRDERAWARVKFEQIPLFYQRCCAAQLRGIKPIATLERFVVYCSCEQIISAAPPGAAQRAQGIAQAVTRHRPISKLKLKVELQTHSRGRTETKDRSWRCRGENRAAKRTGM